MSYWFWLGVISKKKLFESRGQMDYVLFFCLISRIKCLGFCLKANNQLPCLAEWNYYFDSTGRGSYKR